jgi:preprotein translocase subunit YajC
VDIHALLLAAENGSPGTQQQPGGGWGLIAVMVGAFAVLYFLIIWPQRRKEKERQRKREEMLSALKKNDHVMTIGGIYGVVAAVTDDDVTLKVDERGDVRVKVSRDAVSKVLGPEGEEEAAKDAKL